MAGIISSATIALTTVVTVFAAAFPEITHAVLPLVDGNEYTAFCLGLLIAIPGLLLLTVLAAAARE